MKLKHIISGVKNLGIGLVGEGLNYIALNTMYDESLTFKQENRLPHSYTLFGLGKILHNKRILDDGRKLRRIARVYSTKKARLYEQLSSKEVTN